MLLYLCILMFQPPILWLPFSRNGVSTSNANCQQQSQICHCSANSSLSTSVQALAVAACMQIMLSVAARTVAHLALAPMQPGRLFGLPMQSRQHTVCMASAEADICKISWPTWPHCFDVCCAWVGMPALAGMGQALGLCCLALSCAKQASTTAPLFI